ncbi:MAG: hypothetical protein AABY22_23330 [Nanoarchaeota archaeon]
MNYKKLKKNKAMISVIVLTAIILLGAYYFNNTLVTTQYGTSYLSIDRIDNVGVGSQILVYATTGSAENLKIDWDVNELNEELNKQGYMATRGVIADIKLTKWQNNFPITQTSNQFYTIGTQDIYQYVSGELSCQLSDCLNKLSSSQQISGAEYILAYAYGYGATSLVYKCNCLYSKPESQVGDISSGLQNLDYALEFNVKGEKKIMDANNPVVSLNNGRFRAEYVGNLGTLHQLSPPSYDILYSGGKYTQLIGDGQFRYRGIDDPATKIRDCSPKANLFDADTTFDIIAKPKIEQCIEIYNSDKQIALLSKDDEYKTTIRADSVEYSGNNLVVRQSALSFQPTFKIFIDAQWVGLQELKGKPSIISCADKVSIDGGEQLGNQLVVKNIGSNAGQFDYKVQCGSSEVSFFGDCGLVESGQETTCKLLFTGTNNNPNDLLKGSCTHTITDRKSQESATCISQYEVSYSSATCVPSSIRCNPANTKELQKCNTQGTGYELLDTCANSCTYSKNSNSFECSGKNKTIPPSSNACSSCEAFAQSSLFGWVDSTGIFKDKKYQCESKGASLFPPKLAQSNTTCVFSFMKYLAVLFSVLITFILSLQFFREYKTTRRDKNLIWIMTIAVTLAVGLTAYYLWWMAILFVIALFVIKNYLNKNPARYLRFNSQRGYY